MAFVYYFFRRSEVYYYSCTSVYLNAPAIYVFLNICMFKVNHFILRTSKTVERKKKDKIIHYDANQNLILIKYLIYSKLRRFPFRFKKLKQIKFVRAVLKSPVFFKSLLSFFLAFSSSLLALFCFLICVNLVVSFSSFKFLAWLSIMHFFNYILIFWMSHQRPLHHRIFLNNRY